MNNDEAWLFPEAEIATRVLELKFPQLDSYVWTKSKAGLVERYLRYFVYITNHGTYLDAFAGPQREGGKEVAWAAKLVIESNPKRLRHFHLFEKHKNRVKDLLDLKAAQPERPKREIEIHPGDSNKTIPKFLAEHPIKDTEATFCLLDQRTFECDWATVVHLAQHKQNGYKIELFYFLAQAWLDRSLGGKKKNPDSDLARWWGDDTWRVLAMLPSERRGAFAAERFKAELGYKYAYAFPILEHGGDGKNMFWMIHASDHPLAPVKMFDAYRSGGGSICEDVQTDFIEPLQLGITLAPKRLKKRPKKKRRQ